MAFLQLTHFTEIKGAFYAEMCTEHRQLNDLQFQGPVALNLQNKSITFCLVYYLRQSI